MVALPVGNPSKIAYAWPPLACSRKRYEITGALSLFCGGRGGADDELAKQYRSLWVTGVGLLGVSSLETLVRRCRAVNAVVANKQIVVWHDGRDIAARHAVQEQVDDAYNFKRHCRNLTGNDWVVDVGGHLGLVALHVVLLNNLAKVLTVEPSPWNYFLLKLNLLHNVPDVSTRLIALHAAVGSQSNRHGYLEAKHDFVYSWSSNTLGSLAKPNLLSDHTSVSWVGFNASIVTLPALMRRFSISHIALMKLDCEGCEWEVAAEWESSDLWSRIHRLVGELHSFSLPCYSAAVLPNEASSHWRCFPPGLDAVTIKRIWNYLCKARPKTFFMDRGCDDQHLEHINRLVHLEKGMQRRPDDWNVEAG